MKRYAWRHALINEIPFSSLNKIKSTLEFFFGSERFEYDVYFPIPDQMFALLTNHRLSSLYKLAEISNTIDFYRDKESFQVLALHGKKRRLSLDEVQGRLFELYINKILHDNAFNPSINDEYIDQMKNVHPIDISFEFNNEKYLIECLKVSNPNKNLYLRLINDINKISSKYFNKINNAELFSGYFIFHKPLAPEIIHQASQTFKAAINKYFTSFRNFSESKIPLDYQIDNEQFSFKIFSNYVSQLFNLDNITNATPNSLVFKANTKNNKRVPILEFKPGLTHQNIDKHIIDKICKKKQQHRNSPIKKKLVLIEFEKILDNNLYQGSLPISPNDIKTFNFEKIIDQDTTIVFWIKSIDSRIYRTEIGIIDHPDFDKNIKTRLLNLKINWC